MIDAIFAASALLIMFLTFIIFLQRVLIKTGKRAIDRIVDDQLLWLERATIATKERIELEARIRQMEDDVIDIVNKGDASYLNRNYPGMVQAFHRGMTYGQSCEEMPPVDFFMALWGAKNGIDMLLIREAYATMVDFRP